MGSVLVIVPEPTDDGATSRVAGYRRRSRAAQQPVCQWRRASSAASAPNIPSFAQATTCSTPGGIVCRQPGHV